jgi:TolA-binding protein
MRKAQGTAAAGIGRFLARFAAGRRGPGGCLARKCVLLVAGFAWAAMLCAADDALTVARDALRDRLYPLAQRHAEKVLATKDADLHEPAMLALLEALAGQGKYGEILKRNEEDILAGTPRSETAKHAFAYWQALALLETGSYAQAAQVAESATRQGGGAEFTDALLRIAARARQKAGDLNEAWTLYSELDQRSTNAVSRAANALEWALSLAGAGRDDAAMEVLKLQADLPIRNEDVDDGILLRGRLLMKQGKNAEASMVFNQLAMNDRASERARVQALVEMSVYTWGAAKTNEAVAYARSAVVRATQPETRRFAGFRLGDLLMADPKTADEGVQTIKKLVREFPEAPDSMRAQLKLADSLLQAGEAREAAAEYQIFLETYPSSSLDARVLEGRGWALLKLSQYTEASVAFKRAAEAAGDTDLRVECLLKAGDALAEGNRFPEASEAYAQIAESFSNSVYAARALFQSADALERAGRHEAAAAQYTKVAERYAGRDEAPKALIRLAGLEADEGKYDASIKTYASILDKFKQEDIRMDALIGRGKAQYRVYKFDAAMQDFATVAETDPRRRDEARFMLALCLYSVGRDKEARVAGTAFLTDFPESPRVPDMTLWLAKFDFNHGDYVAARKGFLDYVSRWPEARWADAAQLWAARAAFFQNDFTGCVEEVSKLTRKSPASPRMPEAFSLQADALIELARFDEAVLLLDRVVSLAPGSEWAAQAGLRKADCLFTMGADNSHRYEEALAAYKDRIMRGDLPAAALLQIHFKMGRCYEKLKLFDEAINEYYAEVLIRYQEERKRGTWFDDGATSLFMRATFNAAEIAERQGRTDEAVRILRRVVRLDVPGADEARRRIERLRGKKAGE